MHNNLLNQLPSLFFTPPLSHHLRIVGGAVRDSLLCKNSHDIDLACSITPDKMLEYFKSHSISVVTTGMKYGTITPIIDKTPYEITSLRCDIQTDGRHAVVKYTTCWEEDALRRDFTMNALYMDMGGQLYDYFDGQADLYQGRVVFIGSAINRIDEDYLRILRFFRFHAYYGQGDYDEIALNACILKREGLGILSKERITGEFLKILSSPQSGFTLQTLFQTGILDYILPLTELSFEAFGGLSLWEEAYNMPRCPLRTLCLLLILNKKETLSLGNYLRLPKKSYFVLENTLRFFYFLKQNKTLPPLESEEESFLCQSALFIIKALDLIKEEIWLTLWEKTKQPLKFFPMTGQDLLDAGYPKGEIIGQLLKKGKEFWHSYHQMPCKKEVLSHLETLFRSID